jgi:hypothetical protein
LALTDAKHRGLITHGLRIDPLAIAPGQNIGALMAMASAHIRIVYRSF